MSRVVLATAFLLSIVIAPRLGVAFKQIPCPTVISELNRISRKEDKVIRAMEKVAEKLGTSPIWVENCMRTYGRPIPQSVAIDQDYREEVLERMEEVDLAPEDLAPEERAEPDPVYYDEREIRGVKNPPRR